MLKVRLTIAIVGAILLVGGCSSSSDGGGGTGPASAPATAVAAAASATTAEGSDFCSLYATKVAQGLVNIRKAQSDGIVASEGIADELAKKAPVDQARLQAVAPPEPKAWLQTMAKDDAAAAGGDTAAADDILTNITKLNDWSIANCDAKYRSIFTEYKKIVG